MTKFSIEPRYKVWAINDGLGRAFIVHDLETGHEMARFAGTDAGKLLAADKAKELNKKWRETKFDREVAAQKKVVA